MSRLEKTAEEMVLSSTAIRGHLRVNVDPTFARLVLVPGLGAFFWKPIRIFTSNWRSGMRSAT
jgi:DNA-binding transcriptional LysR family regulator